MVRSSMFLLLVFYSTFSNCIQKCYDENGEWYRFKSKYRKIYRSKKEELYRKKIFLENLQSICEHNERFNQNLETYEEGVNDFADMDFDEFRSTHLGFNSKMMKLSNSNSVSFEPTFSRRSDIPDKVNWIKEGAVGRVKRQVGSVEGQLFKRYNKLIELSAQEIVDCSIKFGNEGCISGIMSQSFEYMMENDIATAMEVTNNTRQFVGKSILYDKLCHRSSDFMNHAILIVGYGSHDGSDYWLIPFTCVSLIINFICIQCRCFNVKN